MNSSIYLGGGCFWCIESVFKKVNGVTFTSPGYMGGKSDNPTYEEVCEGYTNHVEVVELKYDQTIDLNQILNIFFTVHDPTSINRQGADVGTQYRSAIFCKPEERSSIVNFIQELESQGIFKDKIVLIGASDPSLNDLFFTFLKKLNIILISCVPGTPLVKSIG